MRQIRGKKALITGAAGGLGTAIALALAREGADLFLVDIDQAGLDGLASQLGPFNIKIATATCDVTRPAAISACTARLLAEWGGVDILVNNVGVGFYGPTDRMTADAWNWLLAVNLHAPIQFTRELLPSLLDRAESHVINMASVCGLVGGPRCTAYHVSKFALVGFSEALRADHGRQGLGVTAICPGPIRTRLYETAPSARPDRPTPIPPRWICTTPDRVASATLRALRRDPPLVLVGWLAYVLYYLKRAVPWLLDTVQRIGRRRKMRRKAAEIAQRQQPSQAGTAPATPRDAA